MITLLWVIIAASVLSLSVSFMFTKAAGRSPLWNIGFAVGLVLTAAGLLAVGLIVIVRKLFPNL